MRALRSWAMMIGTIPSECCCRALQLAPLAPLWQDRNLLVICTCSLLRAVSTVEIVLTDNVIPDKLLN